MAHIMVIDDDHDIIALLRHVLQNEHQITEALDGVEALKKLGIDLEDPKIVVPDLIILDLMLPGIDGYVISLKLAENPRTRSVPVIVLTAKHKMKDYFDAAQNVAAFIGKPFDVKILRETISKTLATGYAR